jgi:hypothetical protein
VLAVDEGTNEQAPIRQWAIVGLGNIQIQRGNLTAALASYQASLAIRQRLAEADPGNAQWQRDLAVSLGRIATVEGRHGSRSDALEHSQRGRDIIGLLVQQLPNNTTLRQGILWQFVRRTDVLQKSGISVRRSKPTRSRWWKSTTVKE